jgi:hypothetical protein
MHCTRVCWSAGFFVAAAISSLACVAIRIIARAMFF